LVAGDPAGVDNNEPLVVQPAVAVLAVTSQTREICDQRITGLGPTIEDGGLAHIGPPYQSDDRNHELYLLATGKWVHHAVNCLPRARATPKARRRFREYRPYPGPPAASHVRRPSPAESVP